MTDQFQAIVFDVDDTLVSTYPRAYQKVAEASRRLGRTAPTFDSFMAVYGRLSFEDCIATWHEELRPQRFIETYESLLDLIPYAPLVNAKRAVERCQSAGLSTGILTNGPWSKTRAKLDAVGVDMHNFVSLRCADCIPHLKPDPSAFLAVVGDLECSPAQVMYVSDYPPDGVGAQRAGLSFAGVTTGAWNVEHFEDVGMERSRIFSDVGAVVDAALHAGPYSNRQASDG